MLLTTQEGRYKATWKLESKLPWREPVHQIFSKIKWIQFNGLSMKNSLSSRKEREGRLKLRQDRVFALVAFVAPDLDSVS
jgi:hypothetical protein